MKGDSTDVEALVRACRGRRLGHRFIRQDETRSTNTDLMALAEDGDAGEGAVMLAESQTGGKGRAGRSWYSPPGMNIYLSVLFGPSIPLGAAPLLPFAAGVAAVRAVRDAAGFTPGLKWPNDLVWKGRKLAGMLSEMKGAGDRVRHLVLGLGLNVNMPSSAFPADLRETATSLLEECGREFDRTAIVACFLREMEDMVFGGPGEGRDVGEGAPARWIEAWSRYDACRGQRLRVTCPEGTFTGVGDGIARDGSILLRMEDGGIRRFTVGDIELLKMRGAP